MTLPPAAPLALAGYRGASNERPVDGRLRLVLSLSYTPRSETTCTDLLLFPSSPHYSEVPGTTWVWRECLVSTGVSETITSVHPNVPSEGLPLGHLVLSSNGRLVVPSGVECLGQRGRCAVLGRGQGARSQPLRLPAHSQRREPCPPWLLDLSDGRK